MALTVKPVAVNAGRVADQIQKATDELIQEVAIAITDAALATDAGAKDRVAVGVGGRLRASIRPTFYQGGLVAEVGAQAKYSAFVEFGTGPRGAATNKQDLPDGYSHGPAYMPPVAALKLWARRILGDERAAFWVARAIKRKGGTEAKPFLGPAADDAVADLEKTLRAIEKRFNQKVKPS